MLQDCFKFLIACLGRFVGDVVKFTHYGVTRIMGSGNIS